MEGSYDPEPTGVRTLPRDEGVSTTPRGMEPRVADPRTIGGSGMGNTSGMGGSGAVTVQPRPSVVRPFSQPQAAKVHITVPVGFNDAQEIGDKLKDNQPVIVNLQGIDRDLSRRLIDFSSGLTYGLGGAMERVAEQVFLLTPSNVEVSAEEKRRLQERGLYRA
jgi:cell division inhibitor SepF